MTLNDSFIDQRHDAKLDFPGRARKASGGLAQRGTTATCISLTETPPPLIRTKTKIKVHKCRNFPLSPKPLNPKPLQEIRMSIGGHIDAAIIRFEDFAEKDAQNDTPQFPSPSPPAQPPPEN